MSFRGVQYPEESLIKETFQVKKDEILRLCLRMTKKEIG
ncbi:hypothetical protein THER_0225 [Thermodesulfovibrio sp. N1]|nr:hypothetical protein THER_0225 [Thermodesulfovibrio sp. N1]